MVVQATEREEINGKSTNKSDVNECTIVLNPIMSCWILILLGFVGLIFLLIYHKQLVVLNGVSIMSKSCCIVGSISKVDNRERSRKILLSIHHTCQVLLEDDRH
jgi:hypothetical protein